MMFERIPFSPVYLAAEEKGKIVGLGGYCQSAINYPIYEAFWLNVIPEFQGKGIGTRLVKGIIKEIKKKRGEDEEKVILLSCTKTELYSRLGFRTLTKYGRGHILMALKLG